MSHKIKAFGEVMMRLEVPDYKKIEQTNELQMMFAGTGVNFLAALTNYGHDTSLITKLPQTNIGQAALKHIRSLGIGTEDVVIGDQYLGIYFLESGFANRPSKVTYSDRQTSSFNQASIDDYHIEAILENTHLIHFCGIALALSETTRQITLNLAERAKELGITVVFDSNYRPGLWKDDYVLARKYYDKMLHLSDIAFMSDKDASLLLQFKTNEETEQGRLEDLLKKVSHQYKIRSIACTRRKSANQTTHQTLQGFLLHDGDIVYSKIYPNHILDRIGAGDAFASGIIHGLVHNLPIEETVEFATAAGVLAHSTYGDTPLCNQEDVWNLIHQDGHIDIER